MAALHDQRIDLVIGEPGCAKLLGGAGQLGLPVFFLELVELFPKPRELAGVESLGRGNDIVYRFHGVVLFVSWRNPAR